MASRADQPPPPAPAGDILTSPEAGGRVIRGGVLRAAGYGAGFVLGTATSVLLLRYLGPADFGRYVTIAALLAIVSGVTDAGLTTIGARELSLLPTAAERARLLANLVTLRLAITPVGVLLAVAFAAVAGYDGDLVLGAVLGGIGVLLVNAQATMMLPLSVDLRMGAVTGVEVLKQTLTLAGVALLVMVGAALLPFFAVQILVGAGALAVTPLLIGSTAGMRPRLDRAIAARLLREALPLAAAITMNVVYFRVLIVLMSLIATKEQTGLFGTSFRVFEVLFALPQLVLGVALPVLSVAGRDDRPRMRYAVQLMTDTALAAGAGVALVVAVAAEPAIVLVAGEEYRDAGPVLSIQALALVPIFAGQAWLMALVSLGRQRALLVANTVALAVVLALGAVLIPAEDARGAAVAAVLAEFVLAGMLLVALRRREPDVAPGFGRLPRIVAALAPAVAVALLTGLPAVAAAAAGGVVFAVAALALGALPAEVTHALARARPGGRG